MLLDAYLQAVARREVVSAPSSDTYPYDVQVAQDMVRECRSLYWNHVHRHGCRVDQKDDSRGH